MDGVPFPGIEAREDEGHGSGLDLLSLTGDVKGAVDYPIGSPEKRSGEGGGIEKFKSPASRC